MKYQIGEQLGYDSNTNKNPFETETDVVIILQTKKDFQEGNNKLKASYDYYVQSLISNNEFFCVEGELSVLPQF
ncbi:hypothetical protein F7018_05510 [Tenacibaculum aiptasiae]|uniref:Uncharacterized protein n=1 Tax=Tenacibaculum aiptasiae TaxID=426481 RepID=A0A7J5AQE1_9FLAO|nr:hypothetical protein [Tenacibaculum aiptasiae]KAB1159767.1 hypothetical protein F7018_05510 [Tenacibaculum aiptasiae]